MNNRKYALTPHSSLPPPTQIEREKGNPTTKTDSHIYAPLNRLRIYTSYRETILTCNNLHQIRVTFYN